jgi:putative endonuclease
MAEPERDNTRARGLAAEDIAVRHLHTHGYRVVARNFTCKFGEIDVIARHGDDLVFVEIRSRHNQEAVDPIYSVDLRKRKKIVRTAQFYLSTRVRQMPICRFDVVIVTLGDSPEVRVFPNAFGEE